MNKITMRREIRRRKKQSGKKLGKCLWDWGNPSRTKKSDKITGNQFEIEIMR